MKVEVKFEIKSNPLSWSNQIIDFTMKNNTKVYLKIENTVCYLILQGSNNLKKVFYAVWELLAWNDGYFYKPIQYIVDGFQHKLEELIVRPYYITDQKWRNSALLIGRANRGIAENTLVKYIEIRNKSRKEKSMNKSLFSAYFSLLSAAYTDVNIEHRLVLLMHVCDGFAIEFLNGNKENNIGNINIIVNQLDIKKKYREGAEKLGITKSRAKDALGDTRNELTHYVFQEGSLGSFISDSNKKTDNMVYLYAFYILDLALRISLLEVISNPVEEKIKEYLLEENLDWIRLEKHLEENCIISRNRLRQILERLQNQQIVKK